MLDYSTDSAICYDRTFVFRVEIVENGLATEELSEPATVDASQGPTRPAFSALLLKSSPFKLSRIL